MTAINNFKIEETFGFMINRTSIILKKRLTTRLKDKGIALTPEEFSLLSRLWEENGITQSLLVEKTIKDKAIVTRMLNNLIKKGYVYKKVNEDDRRNQIVFLTEEGLELQNVIIPIVLELMNLATEGIDSEDVDATHRILRRIFSNLNDVE
jgi:DNA-binding MarR family transcriptional regulator